MAESLRDTIEKITDDVLKEPPAAEPTPAPATEAAPPETTETEAQRAERLRDEKGRFVEGKPEAPAKTEARPKPAPAQAAAPAPEPQTTTLQRPSTWKKEHWESFDQIAKQFPGVAQYILDREGQYAKGVSTYKTEWDNARPLVEAMAEFRPLLDEHKIEPTQWIKNLGNAHRTLALGSQEQKLSMFSRLAQDYGVDLRHLVQQGQDGLWYMRSAPQPQIDINQITQQATQRALEEMEMRATQQEIARFEAQTDKYPHYQEVRETMAGLLQAGLADDLDGAYKAALAHPRHASIYNAIQEQSRKDAEAKAVEEKRKQAESARRRAESPRSSSPTGASKVAASDKKGIRDILESNFDERVAGRV